MAQLTERLVREFLSYADRDEHPPMTANEARQLCYSWLQANGKSTHADRSGLETALEYECNNSDCNWKGPRSELLHPKHTPDFLVCPQCTETVEPLAAAKFCDCEVPMKFMPDARACASCGKQL